jgi:hypothetical protein
MSKRLGDIQSGQYDPALARGLHLSALVPDALDHEPIESRTDTDNA